MKSLFSVYKRQPLGKKLLLSYIIIIISLIFFGSIVVYRLYSINRLNQELFRALTKVEAAKDLQLHVVYLWQYCTDASLTQSIDVLNTEAKASYDSVLAHIDLIKQMHAANPEITSKLAEIKTKTNGLFETGKRMTAAYAVSKADGDLIMAEFDQVNAEAIKDVDKVVKAIRTEADSVSQTNSSYLNFSIYFLVLFAILIPAIVAPLLFSQIKYINGFMDKILFVIKKTAHGIFSHRVTHIKYNDDIGELCWEFNEMVDQLEAFLKETSTSIEYAAQGKYFRKPMSEGLQGMLITGLDNVGKSISMQEASLRAIEEEQAYLNRNIENILTEMDKLAKGDLTVKVTPERNDDEIAKLYAGFNRVTESLRRIINSVTEAVQATASASTQISSSSEEMAAGAQEQSSQTSEIASAVEEMAKTIIETTQITTRAADTAKSSGEFAREGGSVVAQTIEGMNRVADVVKRSAVTVEALGRSSDQIGAIIEVIEDIADQTNLLALNAAIEAARAGEQGRGFAVVADEVRKLAERTTKATKEIASMIKKIQEDTTEAVTSMTAGTAEVEKGKELADKAGHTLQDIINQAQEVVDLVTQVAAASEQQSKTAEQISQNIDGISTITHESAQGIQQIAHAAEDLSRLTVSLQDMTSKFNLGKTGHQRRILE